MSGYFRHPKTLNEKKANQDWPVRGRRMSKRLPHFWDDIWNRTTRCWKKTRKTQYRVKSVKPKKDSTRYGKSMAKRDHFYKEHKACRYERRRCTYCIKHGCWDEYDKYIERHYRRILAEQPNNYF